MTKMLLDLNSCLFWHVHVLIYQLRFRSIYCLLLPPPCTFSYTQVTLQVGLPIAAGALLPATGTILTPSIAGALMGFSSVGVMANSLLLRVRLSSRRKREPLKAISDEVEKNYSSKWSTWVVRILDHVHVHSFIWFGHTHQRQLSVEQMKQM